MKGRGKMKTYSKSCNAAVVTAVILMAAVSFTGCKGKSVSDASDKIDIRADMDAKVNADIDADIDIDALNESVESIKNLKFDTDTGADPESNDTGNDTAQAGEPSGDKTVYSFTDVYADGNDLTVIPNGGLNPQTVLHGGKDLKGFLDYVDSEVLEEGRTINREFFYDMLAVMLVDKDLSSDEDTIEKDLIMALAMANNFHDTDVKINDCYLNAANAAEYRYHVTAYGKDDTWVVNYRDRTMYMNDGRTEYVSEMFKDEYLAVWMVAIEDYYGLIFK